MPCSSGAWEKQLETLTLASLRLIFRRTAPKELQTPSILQNKQSLIDGCLRLPPNSAARAALNDAIATRAREKAQKKIDTQRAAKAKRQADAQARRLTRAETCAAMYHDSLGDVGMFMEKPTPSEVSTISPNRWFAD
jgi:hypothetical protein